MSFGFVKIVANAVNVTEGALLHVHANDPKTSTELYRLIVQNQVSLETLRNANTQFGYLNRFFNTAA